MSCHCFARKFTPVPLWLLTRQRIWWLQIFIMSFAPTFRKIFTSVMCQMSFGTFLSVSYPLGPGHKQPDVGSATFANATRSRLNGKDRERALWMLMALRSGVEVGRQFGVHRSTIQRLSRKFQQIRLTMVLEVTNHVYHHPGP